MKVVKIAGIKELAAVLACAVLLAIFASCPAWASAQENGNYKLETEKPREEDPRPLHEIFIDLSGTAERQREENERNAGLISWGGAVASMPSPAPLITLPVGAMIFASSYHPAWFVVPPARLQLDVAEASGGGPLALVGNALQNTVGTVLNGLANMVFSVAQAPVTWGVELVYLAFKTQWLALAASKLAEHSQYFWRGIVGESPASSRFISLTVLVLAGIALYYLARARYIAILKGAGIAVLVLVLAFAYFANAGPVLTAVASLTDGLSGVVLSAVGSIASVPDLPAQDGQAALNIVLQRFGSSMWAGLVAGTWTALQFGTTRPDELYLTDWEYEQVTKNTVFKENSYDPNTGRPVDPVNEGWIIKNMRADQLLAAYAYSSPCRSALVNILASHDRGADHGKHPLTAEKMSPVGKATAITYSLFFLVVALVFFVFCLIIAGSMIVAQVTLMLIALALPLIFLIAMIPEWGWSLGYKAARMALSALMTKIVYGVFLSLVVLVVNLVWGVF